MFSGIIEEFATIVAIHQDRDNIDFTLTCSFVNELSIDQSVAHNGVCLTVVHIENNQYVVTAMKCMSSYISLYVLILEKSSLSDTTL